MRLRIEALLAALLPLAATAAPVFHYQVVGADAGAWPAILGSVGFTPGANGIVIVREPPREGTEDWVSRVEQGAKIVLEGESGLAGALGFRRDPGIKPRAAQSVLDEHSPKLQIIWQHPLNLGTFSVPAGAKVFAREKWTGMPLAAGLRRGKGAVLWLAAAPGELGHERFPYMMQAMADLGWEPPFRTRRLWAFFDASYRSRADLDYLAERWRKAGIGALQVAAWHLWEPDAERDAYLKRLVEACHRRAITVYAWLELPHVSEKFWHQHPEWREKTAAGQDAFLDWRKLMDLNNADCARTVKEGMRHLITRFDWDGVNLAELYFESLEGHANAARFTPMNETVRRRFATEGGFDPRELFDAGSPRHYSKDPGALRRFLDWRAELAVRLQQEWVSEVESMRTMRPDLDLVLTHVDDRYDAGMRDRIGADAARVLPLLHQYDFTFLVEDPATVWNLKPERYRELAARYAPITPRPRKLAIDINIVERYQDVYPTKQQTGTELFQLVHTAAAGFPRVALYFENSILAPDLPLLSAAAALPERVTIAGDKVAVQSSNGLGVPWQGPVRVNGQEWPVAGEDAVWLPPGAHVLEPGQNLPHLRLIDFSGDLRSAAVTANGMEFAYQSDSRAIAVFDRAPTRVRVDGADCAAEWREIRGGWMMLLPRGQHLVSAAVE